MPTLTVKGLPDSIYQRLKARAAANHRSLNGEIIQCLQESVGPQRVDPATWLAEADAFRARLNIVPFTAEELQQARRDGRA